MKEHHTKLDMPFIRAGQHLVNPNHIAFIELPADGDATNALQVKLSTGENFTLAGDDATAALEALGTCCDVEPTKPEKAEKAPKPHPAHAK